jgi:3-deoxy-D-manno-octulosonic acid kinase
MRKPGSRIPEKMSSDNQFKIKKIGNSSILYDDSVIAEPSPQLFDPGSSEDDYHTNTATHQNIVQQKNSAAVSQHDVTAGIGRAPVCYFRYENTPLVLKHYYRGGMMARLSKDLYLGCAIENSRSFKEFRLLSRLHALGLPVPQAVAARVDKHLCFYQADLITREIEDVSTLADVLSIQALDAETWNSIGQTIKRFHDHDVYHADLNARNILLSRAGGLEVNRLEVNRLLVNNIYLIDFDNSSIRSATGSWKSANLARLNRSLKKFKNNTPGFNFNQQDWESLVSGYR